MSQNATSDSPVADITPERVWSVATALEILAGNRDLVDLPLPPAAVLRAQAETIKALLAWQYTASGGEIAPDGAVFAFDPVAEAERSIREAQNTEKGAARLERWSALLALISDAADAPQVREQLRELDWLHAGAVADAEDGVLRTAAQELLDARRWDLFARMYARVREGCVYEPGDEVDFWYGRSDGSLLRGSARKAVITLAWSRLKDE